MLVAGIPSYAQACACLALQYTKDDNTFQGWHYDQDRCSHVQWLPSERLAIISDDSSYAKIRVFKPFKGDLDALPPILTMDCECRWVECEGHLLVLQARNSTVVRVFDEPYGNDPVVECDMRFEIRKCSFSNGILVAVTVDHQWPISIWDTREWQRPHRVAMVGPTVDRIQALETIDVNHPIFALIGEESLIFLDKYGHLSVEREKIWENDVKSKIYSRIGDFAVGVVDSEVRITRYRRVYG
jgi:hypothetical protein